MSCLVRVVKNLVAFPRSPSPLLKKKLTQSMPSFSTDLATVRQMVDFPVPAIPFSQYMGLLREEVAHSAI